MGSSSGCTRRWCATYVAYAVSPMRVVTYQRMPRAARSTRSSIARIGETAASVRVVISVPVRAALVGEDRLPLLLELALGSRADEPGGSEAARGHRLVLVVLAAAAADRG